MIDLYTKAGLAFHHIANGEFDAVERLYATIEMRDYTCTDFGFSNRLSSALLFTGTWGGEYWKCRALLAEAEISGNSDSHAKMAGRCMAIDAALEIVCAKYGLDPDDARKIAHEATKPNVVNAPCDLDEEYLADRVAAYSAMMDSCPGNVEQKGSEGTLLH